MNPTSRTVAVPAVETVPFVSRLYKDPESVELDRQIFAYHDNRPDRVYFSWDDFVCGDYRGGHLGKVEKESLARQLLLFSSRVSRIVGVPEEEFFRFIASGHFTMMGTNDQFFIEDLARRGYFRKEIIGGLAVLFPSEQLLRAYRCGVSSDPLLVQVGMHVSLRGDIETYRGRRDACDFKCKTLGKQDGTGTSMREVLGACGYAVLETLPRNQGEFTRHFLFLGARLIEVKDAEVAEWLGELFAAEGKRPHGEPRNAFERYMEDYRWGSAHTTFTQEDHHVFIQSVI